MRKRKYKNRNKGFTLIELLVTISIVAILAGIGTIAVVKIRGTTHQVTCMKNLKSISSGLQLYYNDFMVFPDDGYPYDAEDGSDDGDDLYPLSTELAGYINNKSTFVCPEDKDPTSTGNFASYDPYYVARTSSALTDTIDQLSIGCPRHRGNNSSTSLFSSSSTEITKIGTVLANGQEIPPDGTTAERTINSVGDVMTFDDWSTVTITNNSGGSYGCILIQSVQLADGTLYSIIKVQDDGIIDVQVTSGSKFEVVTPSAIVGVRGTEFTVQTSNSGGSTDVTITSGKVIVIDRASGETNTLTPGSTPSSTISKDEHFHEHWHAGGTKHTHAHPKKKNAHHGKKKGKKHKKH
ncbi:MAG: prepilin-type N-terminal cleavage/methylation domain-containing protein [Candidatus Scalindua sp.]